MPRNYYGSIIHPHAPRQLDSLFAMNRSFQEMRSDYDTVEDFFSEGFEDADICLLSSHADSESMDDIQQMIEQLQYRCYNVAGVFFSNGFDDNAPEIARLDWQERLWVTNDELSDSKDIDTQLHTIAREFAELLLARSRSQ